MVDIEVDDSGTLQPVRVAGVERADGDIVEEAKAHGLIRLGVMSRRADGAEGIAGATGHDFINRMDDSTGGTERGFDRAR